MGNNFTPAWFKKGFFNESLFCDDFLSMHLLKNLPGDKAWRHDKSLYPSNQPRLHHNTLIH